LGDSCSAESGPVVAVARWLPAPRNDGDAGAAGLGLHFVEQLLLGGTACVKRRRSRGVRFKDALDDEAVEVLNALDVKAEAGSEVSLVADDYLDVLEDVTVDHLLSRLAALPFPQ